MRNSECGIRNGDTGLQSEFRIPKSEMSYEPSNVSALWNNWVDRVTRPEECYHPFYS